MSARFGNRSADYGVHSQAAGRTGSVGRYSAESRVAAFGPSCCATRLGLN